jgi:outer membrane protein, heavy metal efflux system
MYPLRSVICLTSFILFPLLIKAQTLSLPTDTLSINLDTAEVMFIRNNLNLLAQKYNVDAAQAQIIQARLWSNPNVTINQGAYNPSDDKWFELNNNGETAVQLQQLILLAGKRNKQIKMAETNYRLSQYELYDVLRTLQYTLQADFYNTYYLQQSASVYTEEISSLQKVVSAFTAQESKGYISEKEVVRIEALLYSLQSEYADLLNQLYDKESEMRILLHSPDTSYIIPLINQEKIDSLDPEAYSLEALIDTAYQDRSDMKIAEANLTLSKENYAYQKALAVPDLTLGAGYDKNGSYVHNANFLSASIDLPFFNRNQGNIRTAKSMIAYNDIQLESEQEIVAEQVTRAMQKAIDADKLYHSVNKNFSTDFEKLVQQVLINYQKRNISLLDFLDFYDAYKQTTLDLNTISFNRISAFEEINYATGKNFFN